MNKSTIKIEAYLKAMKGKYTNSIIWTHWGVSKVTLNII